MSEEQSGEAGSLVNYYDRQGDVIDLLDWSSKYEDPTYRFIADTYIRDWRIATIWIGHDLNVIGLVFAKMEGCKHIPVIFETMIFPPYGYEFTGQKPAFNFGCVYATEQGATEGHRDAVKMVLSYLHAGESEIEDRTPKAVVQGEVTPEAKIIGSGETP
jgi:hypothetical protein